MTSGYQVVLDACVLVDAVLRDTLLRVAEPPRLYLLRWSKDILEENTRTLQQKIGLPRDKIKHLIEQLEIHFAGCWVEGYEPLITAMKNHSKGRHVLAAAVRTGAQTIVTFNIKDFPAKALAQWNVEAQTPDEFLILQFHLDSTVVLSKIYEQASAWGGLERLLEIQERTMPAFAELIRSRLF